MQNYATYPSMPGALRALCPVRRGVTPGIRALCPMSSVTSIRLPWRGQYRLRLHDAGWEYLKSSRETNRSTVHILVHLSGSHSSEPRPGAQAHRCAMTQRCLPLVKRGFASGRLLAATAARNADCRTFGISGRSHDRPQESMTCRLASQTHCYC